MILSVSRRTDIPNYFSDWFFNRIKEGFVYVRNPLNAHQISKIDLSPKVIDCIVFWTKNPERMIDRLDELKDYNYYFQFTLTGYGKDVEPRIPDKKCNVISTFKKLSDRIQKERVIWRYDPILINEKYNSGYHIKAFKQIAENLSGYTEKVIISFVDLYLKTQRNTAGLKLKKDVENELVDIVGEMSKIAKNNGLIIETCAERVDLLHLGVQHGSCIDKSLIEKIIGCKIRAGKDKNQREECGCIESIDIGAYNTCINGCKYCYANFNDKQVTDNFKLFDPNSPLLCGNVRESDKIIERPMKSLKERQISFLD